MPPTFVAETYLGRANAGRSKPPLLQASDGVTTRELFVKFPMLHSKLSAEKLSCEWIAARLALAIGLPSAKPHQVMLHKEFIATLPTELREILYDQDCLAYGSESLGTQWRVWSLDATMPRNALPMLVAIYLFDTIIQNWDRSVSNPNLLKRGDEVAILDHEEAFQPWITGAEVEEPRPYPWEANGIDNFFQGDAQHVLWRSFVASDMDIVREALVPWKGLSNDQIGVYVNEIPPQWDQVAGARMGRYLELALASLELFESRIEELLRHV